MATYTSHQYHSHNNSSRTKYSTTYRLLTPLLSSGLVLLGTALVCEEAKCEALEDYCFFPEYETKTDVIHWLTYYYKHPNPNLIQKAFSILGNHFPLSDKETNEVCGAFAALFRSNPDKIQEWMEETKTWREGNSEFLYIALWAARTKETREYLEKIHQTTQNSKLKQDLSDLLNRKAPNLLDTFSYDIYNVEMLMGMLAGEYSVSSNRELIDILARMAGYWTTGTLTGEQDLSKFYVGSKARTHLLQLSFAHSAVLQIAQQYVETSLLDEATIKEIKNIHKYNEDKRKADSILPPLTASVQN